MKKLILLISVLVVVFMVPICSYADCGQDCSRKCDPLGSGREWAACMEKCMKGCYYKPIPTPEIAQIGEPMILAQIPEPNCVCAECGKKCGTGHATWCSSYRVNPSTGTTTSPPPKQKVCTQTKTLTIKYVCGTQQKCTDVKRKDSSPAGYHYETVCVDVEKYCTKTEEVCTKWE